MRLGIFVLLASATWAQTGKPVFEAATIKPADPQASGSFFNTDPGRMDGQNWTLKSYILIAYSLRPYQLNGITSWMDSDRYDIQGKLEDMGPVNVPSGATQQDRRQAEDARIRVALQRLLAERFHLKLHRETKTMQGYALSIAKSGFKPAPVDGSTAPSMRYGGGHLTAKFATMDRMAIFLEAQLNQPVANLTHLSGIFDFTLDWTPEELLARATGDGPPASSVYVASDPSKTASIYTALQEQLGLKLEPQKVPVEVLVIEGAERPSRN